MLLKLQFMHILNNYGEQWLQFSLHIAIIISCKNDSMALKTATPLQGYVNHRLRNTVLNHRHTIEFRLGLTASYI